MAAKGKKKQRSKNNHKSKKQIEEEDHEEEQHNEFDLEAMERMLAEEDKDDDDDDKEEEQDGVEQNDSDKEEDEEEEEDDDDEGDESGTEEESEDDREEEAEAEAESDNDEEQIKTNNNNRENQSITEGNENCTLDLRNLLAINPHQLNLRSLYKQPNKQKSKNDEDKEDITTTICIDGAVKANEDYLLQKASEGCSQLLAGLWGLETEKSDAGPMAILPTYCEVVTPRELPPPAQKTETKWEKFAKERGIAPKEKRSRKVWDEATQSWAYRTGYQKSTSMDDPESWPIMEVKKNDDPFENPWQRARDAKKERIEKNVLNRMKNAEMGGVLDRGTARRVMKAKKDAREKGRAGGDMDLKKFTTAPAGIPMDLVEGKQRGKSLTKMALLATQTSTASMGKFDKMREGEPERKKSMSGLKKRKYESSTSDSVVKSESKKSLKVLENVISGGGKAKDRAIRRGQYAKGETGHDYDFDDGLGPSTFRKKKGRAGIGKMKKITKKLAK